MQMRDLQYLTVTRDHFIKRHGIGIKGWEKVGLGVSEHDLGVLAEELGDGLAMV